MKAFEKWFWNKYDPHDDSYDEDTILKTCDGWKAALEWVLKNEREYAIFKEFNGKKSIPMVGADIIREELENVK